MKEQCTSCDKIIENDDDRQYCISHKHEIIPILESSELTSTKPTKNKKIALKLKNDKIIKKMKGQIGDYFIESIVVNDKPHFLCNYLTGNILCLKESIELEDKIFKPMEANQCGYQPYAFTNEEITTLLVQKLSKEEILDQIKEQIDKFINAREIDKHLIIGDIILSYCQEWISTVHYPYFVGDTESGKSSALHLFKRLGYRCLYGEDIPNADIYNFLGTEEEGAGTIAEDEAQNLWEYKEKLRTYKNSYCRGSVKPRIVTTNYSKTQVYYKTFCLKIFAGEKVPQDKGFLERLAIIHMIQGPTQSNIKRLTSREESDLNGLRNKLLVWKVQNFKSGLARIDSGLKQRDQELWEDFLSAVHDTKYFEKCKNVVTFYTQQRQEVVRNSSEARIFKLITSRLDKNLEINSLDFWEYITNDNPELPGRFDDKHGTFYSDDYGKFTKNSLARLLEDKFQGLRRIRYEKDDSKYHKKTFYVFSPDVVQRLVLKYGVTLSIDSQFYSGQSGQAHSTN